MAPRAAALEDATDPADVATWLRKRGMSRRAEISRDDRRDLAACFSLLDEEDAGAIGAEALREAFRVLGLPRGSLERCRRLVDDASTSRNGAIEFPEFVEILASEMASAKDNDRGDETGSGDRTNPESDPRLPFELLAVAHRRRRLIDRITLNADGARVREMEAAEARAETDAATRKARDDALRRRAAKERAKAKYLGEKKSAAQFELEAVHAKMRKERRRFSMAYEDGARAATLDEAGFPAKRTTVRSSTNGTSRMYTGSKRTDDARGVAGRISPPPGASGFFLPDGTACAVGEDGVAVVSMATRAAPTRPEEEDDATRRVRLDRRVADARAALAARLGLDPNKASGGTAPETRRRVAREREAEAREAMRASGDIKIACAVREANDDEGDFRGGAGEGALVPSALGTDLLEDSDDSRSDDDEGSRPDRLATDARPALVEALASLTADEAEAMRRAISASKAAARGGGADATPVRGGAFPGPPENTVGYDSPPGTNTRARTAANSSGVFFAASAGTTPTHTRSGGSTGSAAASTATPSRRPGATARRAALEAARSRGMFGGETRADPPRFRSVFVGKKAGVDAEALRGGEEEKGGSFVGGSASKKTGARAAKKSEWIERRDSNLARPSGTRAALEREALRSVREAAAARRAGGGFSSADDFDVGPLDALNLREAARGTAGQRGRGAMLVELGLPDHNFARTTI